MGDQGYNGWTNYETWAVALWIDNERWSYDQSREYAKSVIEDFESGDACRRAGCSDSTWELADLLKDWQDDQRPEMDASVWSDLLNAAFSEVNWHEIATNLLDEVRQETDA